MPVGPVQCRLQVTDCSCDAGWTAAGRRLRIANGPLTAVSPRCVGGPAAAVVAGSWLTGFIFCRDNQGVNAVPMCVVKVACGRFRSCGFRRLRPSLDT